MADCQRLQRLEAILTTLGIFRCGYDCYQNALAVHIRGILTYEFRVVCPANLTEARQLVAQSVAIYNRRRPNMSSANQMPDQVYYQAKAAPT